jgi:uncharacterized protein YbjT (DUF2867 family)
MILLTGATGYVGGRLLRRLTHMGAPVRCLSRNPATLRAQHPGLEVVKGDLRDEIVTQPAFVGVHTAFYLVHSMGEGADFEEQERRSARNFAVNAQRAGVQRIIYLGGLAQGSDLSPHMRSRAGTGNALRSTGVPVIEFRASVIIGSGSASFEMIRALVDKLPLMITPRWVSSEAQPIAIEDVIEYLVQAIDLPVTGSLVVEIGGRDVTSYLGIMREFARQNGLKRMFLRVPMLSLSLSSRWLTLITPLYARIGRHLIESVRNPSVVQDPLSAARFAVQPMGLQEAIFRAILNEDRRQPMSRWSDAAGRTLDPRTEPSSQRLLTNIQTVHVPLPPEAAFAPVRRIGGHQGWYFGNALWRIRGLIDALMGGVGMRRGRPDSEIPIPGTNLDFWRVEEYAPGSRLRLRAEMKVPGRAWLEFEARPKDDSTELIQTARFAPSGWFGDVYWYLLWPVHEVMFRGMLHRIAATALNSTVRDDPYAAVSGKHGRAGE